mmetsp:Transcript_3524/g.5223  ORF Transcript_3524/g.5223 Transcript_3524/m.5223 type:complete len:703 (-) Transcript_3524:473-2581(-)
MATFFGIPFTSLPSSSSSSSSSTTASATTTMNHTESSTANEESSTTETSFRENVVDEEEEMERRKVQECMDALRHVITTAEEEEVESLPSGAHDLSTLSSPSFENEANTMSYGAAVPCEENGPLQQFTTIDSMITTETRDGTNGMTPIQQHPEDCSTSSSSYPLPFSLYDSTNPFPNEEEEEDGIMYNLQNAPCFAESDEDDTISSNKQEVSQEESQLSFRASMMDDSLDITHPSLNCNDGTSQEEGGHTIFSSNMHSINSLSTLSPAFSSLPSSSSLPAALSNHLSISSVLTSSQLPSLTQEETKETSTTQSAMQKLLPSSTSTTTTTKSLQNIRPSSSMHDSTTFWNVGHSLLYQHENQNLQHNWNMHSQDNKDVADTTMGDSETATNNHDTNTHQEKHWYSNITTEDQWNEMKQFADLVWDALTPEERNISIPIPPPVPPTPPPVSFSSLDLENINQEEIQAMGLKAKEKIPNELICPFCNDVIVGAIVLNCSCTNCTCCNACVERHEKTSNVPPPPKDKVECVDGNDYVFVENVNSSQSKERKRSNLCPSCCKVYTNYIHCPALDVAILNTLQNLKEDDGVMPFVHFYYQRLFAWKIEVESRHEEYNVIIEKRKERVMMMLLQREEETFWNKGAKEDATTTTTTSRVNVGNTGNARNGGRMTTTVTTTQEERSKRLQMLLFFATAAFGVLGLNYRKRQ